MEEIPYWETINRYLEKVDPDSMQQLVTECAIRLMNNRIFSNGKINGAWQVIIDGSQLKSSKTELDGNYIIKVHNKGKENEYIEYCYYILEAKIVLSKNVVISVLSELVANTSDDFKKQDCELNAAMRLLDKLYSIFPDARFCITGDALYSCESFFDICLNYNWDFIVRYKAGTIPSIFKQFETLQQVQKNRFIIKETRDDGEVILEYDFVNGIEYKRKTELKVLSMGMLIDPDPKHPYPFYYISNLILNKKMLPNHIELGRRRWCIETSFDIQKNHGYNIEHMYSNSYNGMRNHYYLLQISHMISQLFEARIAAWNKIHLTLYELHRNLLNSWRSEALILCDNYNILTSGKEVILKYNFEFIFFT